ncbi:MAG: AAA family ATPase [Bacteroidia bacterium]|nr:AAA family ATPase [Bacteroidia bacterium]
MKRKPNLAISHVIRNQKKRHYKSALKLYEIFKEQSSEISIERVFIYLYNELYHLHNISKYFDLFPLIDDLLQKFAQDGCCILHKNVYSRNKDMVTPNYHSFYLLQIKDRVLARIEKDNCDIVYGRSISEKELHNIIEVIKRHIRGPSIKKRNQFFMISKEEFGLVLQKFEIKNIETDITSHYNDDFPAVDSEIKKFINTDKANGIVLLHGKVGTGKTSYIRHLIQNTRKKVIYLPFHLLDVISNPDFLSFISNHTDSILIIEDCEDILKIRQTGTFTNPSLVNLLNLGDGLLGDALSVKVICTFNTGIKTVDPAILRKGRLIARYEFRELETHKAQILLNKLGINIRVEKSITLAEIYNFEKNDYQMTGILKEIGFQTFHQ